MLAVVLLSAAMTAYQPSAKPPDMGAIGPKVGQVVPDFELRDQDGRRRSLSALIGPNGAMLVFFRSADW